MWLHHLWLTPWVCFPSGTAAAGGLSWTPVTPSCRAVRLHTRRQIGGGREKQLSFADCEVQSACNSRFCEFCQDSLRAGGEQAQRRGTVVS